MGVDVEMRFVVEAEAILTFIVVTWVSFSFTYVEVVGWEGRRNVGCQ
jgi:hypothetical protein